MLISLILNVEKVWKAEKWALLPKDVYSLLFRTYAYVTLHSQRDFADVTKLIIL